MDRGDRQTNGLYCYSWSTDGESSSVELYFLIDLFYYTSQRSIDRSVSRLTLVFFL